MTMILFLHYASFFTLFLCFILNGRRSLSMIHLKDETGKCLLNTWHGFNGKRINSNISWNMHQCECMLKKMFMSFSFHNSFLSKWKGNKLWRCRRRIRKTLNILFHVVIQSLSLFFWNLWEQRPLSTIDLHVWKMRSLILKWNKNTNQKNQFVTELAFRLLIYMTSWLYAFQCHSIWSLNVMCFGNIIKIIFKTQELRRDMKQETDFSWPDIRKFFKNISGLCTQ